MVRQLTEQKFCSWCGAQVEYTETWVSQCPQCGYRNFINPGPCCAAIIHDGSQVLMVKRNIDPGRGQLDLPGGFVDIGDDSFETATLRELQEELGLTAKDFGKLAYAGSGSTPYLWMNVTLVNVVVYYTLPLKASRNKVKLDSENSAVRWISPSDLPDIDFAWDIDKQMLQKFFGVKQ